MIRLFEAGIELETFSIKSLLKNLHILTKDLKFLLIPQSLIENDNQLQTDEEFEEDFEKFKEHFGTVCKYVATFIKKIRQLDSKNSSLKDVGFIKSFDKEILDTEELYLTQINSNVQKSKDFLDKIQNAFYAYMQLVEVVNLAIEEYNENYKEALPVLKNTLNSKTVKPPIKLDSYFKDWLEKLIQFLSRNYSARFKNSCIRKRL